MANFESAVTRNLECSICLSLLTDPKQLTCTHTFCKRCLHQSLRSSNPASKSISCPLCRHTTHVSNGKISNLPTNVPLKAIVSDVKAIGQQCEPFDGKAVPKRKVYCKEHKPGEGKQECTDVCITCKKFICVRCRFLEHGKKGHDVKSYVEYQDSFLADANRCKEKTVKQIATINKHIDFVKTQERKVIRHMDELSENIIKAHDEVTWRLNKEEKMLLQKCNTEKDNFCRDLDSMTENLYKMVTSIESVCDLVEKSCTITPMDGDTIVIRELLCDKSKTVLKAAIDSSPAKVTDSAEKLKYNPKQNIGQVGLGKLKYNTRELRTDIALRTNGTIHCMVATPDGMIAVGCAGGKYGIEIYSADGQLQKTVLGGKDVHAMGFLSDGRCVVRDTTNNNTVSTYTPGWEKLDVEFDTLSLDEGGYGNLTVHSDHHIYVSYRKAKKIQVFTPAGWNPVREIQCDGYEPMQIFAMTSRKMLVVKDSNYSARVIDSESGCEHHTLVRPASMFVQPALREDDTILIATVNYDRSMTIEHYTSELKRKSTLITNHVIEKTKRGWFDLQELLSGHIVFCTSDRLYIFH